MPAHVFLSQHKEVLDLTAGDGFRAGLRDTTGKEIFLLGESHGTSQNTDLDLAQRQPSPSLPGD